MTGGLRAAKRAARAVARHARTNVDMPTVGAAIVGHLRAWEGLSDNLVVLVYWASADEPDITEAGGDGAMVTRTNEDASLTIHPVSSQRERHPYGFEQPIAGSLTFDPETIDVALVPGLAFDNTGTRLGRGAGYYDRLLVRLRPGATIVGVAPEAVIGIELPREAHDVPMTHLAGESGVRSVY